MEHWKQRVRAASIHLCISLAVAVFAAVLVFFVWYPYPYREIAGGRELFLLVVMIDVVLGPLITLIVFDRRKPSRELRRDLTFVALIQIAALVYGMWTVFVARPIHLVFEIDRFRVVHAIDLNDGALTAQAVPMFGPTLLAVRPFKDANESFDATYTALTSGSFIAARPELWESYDAARVRVRTSAQPVSQLKNKFPLRATEIDSALRSVGRDPDRMAYLPLVARKTFWTVVIDPATSDIVAFLPLDPF